MGIIEFRGQKWMLYKSSTNLWVTFKRPEYELLIDNGMAIEESSMQHYLDLKKAKEVSKYEY